MAISKSDARRLALNGLEMGAHVLRGVVTTGPNGIQIDGKDVSDWLAEHEDMELILIAAPIGQVAIDDPVKSCYTCGRDYQGDHCPYCARARARLRG